MDQAQSARLSLPACPRVANLRSTSRNYTLTHLHVPSSAATSRRVAPGPISARAGISVAWPTLCGQRAQKGIGSKPHFAAAAHPVGSGCAAAGCAVATGASPSRRGCDMSPWRRRREPRTQRMAQCPRDGAGRHRDSGKGRGGGREIQRSVSCGLRPLSIATPTKTSVCRVFRDSWKGESQSRRSRRRAACISCSSDRGAAAPP